MATSVDEITSDVPPLCKVIDVKYKKYEGKVKDNVEEASKFGDYVAMKHWSSGGIVSNGWRPKDLSRDQRTSEDLNARPLKVSEDGCKAWLSILRTIPSDLYHSYLNSTDDNTKTYFKVYLQFVSKNGRLMEVESGKGGDPTEVAELQLTVELGVDFLQTKEHRIGRSVEVVFNKRCFGNSVKFTDLFPFSALGFDFALVDKAFFTIGKEDKNAHLLNLLIPVRDSSLIKRVPGEDKFQKKPRRRSSSAGSGRRSGGSRRSGSSTR